MADLSVIKTEINTQIVTNGVNAITADVLNDVLIDIVDALGEGYTFLGVATPSMTPSTPDRNGFYLGGIGLYNNFGGNLYVYDGELGVFTYNGSWSGYKADFGRVMLAKSVSCNDVSYTSAELSEGNVNNNSVGSALTFGGLSTYYCGVFPCGEGVSVTIKTTGGANAVRGLAFCDKNMEVLYASSSGSINATYVAPADTLYVAVNCQTSSLSSFALSVKGTLTSDVENISERMEEITDTERKFTNSYTSTDLKLGNVINSTIGNALEYGTLATMYYGVFPCAESSIIHVNTTGGSGTSIGFAFCDEDMVVLDKSGTGAVNKYFIPPTGARYVAVNCTSADVSSFSLYVAGYVDDNFKILKSQEYTYTDLFTGNISNKTIGSAIAPSTLNTYLSGIFPCYEGQLVEIVSVGGSNTSVAYAFCDSSFVVLSSSGTGGQSASISVPSGTSYIAVNCLVANQSTFSLKIKSVAQEARENAEKANKLYNYNSYTYSSSEMEVGNVQNNSVGSPITISTLSTYKHGIFPCTERMFVDIKTYAGTNTARPLAFCDENLVVLETTSSSTIDSVFVAPEGTAYIVVNLLVANESDFRLVVSTTYNPMGMPQIYNRPLYKIESGHTLKVLFFGSSHFFDTWWYQNYLLSSAGIDADLTAFFIGGGTFSQWVNAYNNNTAQNCYKSSSGSTWAYSSENFADVLNEGGWDMIAFQYGNASSIDWNNKLRESWSEMVSIVRRCCNPDTMIALNGTFTPALGGDMSPYEQTTDGQQLWQTLANRNLQLFMKLSGIDNVAPQGAAMWAMRRNASLNVSNDMATDGLHPDSGLPIYGLAATFYETFFAPICGVSIDDIDWLPTSSTPRPDPSISYYQSIDSTQQGYIRQIVKLALSDRFGFRTL